MYDMRKCTAIGLEPFREVTVVRYGDCKTRCDFTWMHACNRMNIVVLGEINK